MQRTLNNTGKSLKFSLFLFIAVLIFTPFVSADLSDGLVSYYTFDSDASDSLGVNDLGVVSGSPNLVTGKLGNAYNFVTASSECLANVSPSNINLQDTTISFWVNYDVSASANAIHYGDVGSSNFEGWRFTTDASSKVQFQVMETSTTAVDGVTNNAVSTGTWYHIVGVINDSANTVYIWRDGAKQLNTGAITSVLYGSDDLKVGCVRSTTARVGFFDGQVDEIGIWNRSLTEDEIAELYNSGDGLAYENFSSGSAPGFADEIIEKESFLQQSGSTTINNVNYVSVLSGDVTLNNDTWLYGSATIPIINPAQSNQADCRIGINGSELNNSETSRSLTAGQNGNVLLSSFEHYVTAGTYAFSLDCKRTGAGSFTIQNSTLYLHVMSDLDGNPINTVQSNITSASISGLIDSFSITTTANDTDSGYTRALVTEWTAEYDYTSTQNMSVTVELAGTNCTPVTRYGSTGGLGNVAGSCMRTGLTNSTTYDVKVYGSGTGNLENAVFHVKEFVLHSTEIAETNLTGVSVDNNSFEVLASHNITINPGHSSPHLLTQVVVSVLSNNGTAQSSFYLSDGTSNSSTVPRTVGQGQPGVIGIQYNYENVSGTKNMSLYGLCDNANCTLTGVSLVSYITNDLAITPNSFNIGLNNTYTDTAINEFNLIVDSTTYSTTTGNVEVFTTDALVNITFPANNDTIPPFFPNNTLNHDTTTNLTIVGTPWTSVYALEPDSSTVYNYTISYVNLNDSTENGSWTTTTGVAYVPLYNATYNLTITGAVGNDSTNFAIQSQTVNTSGYLENYTFNLLVANSINITYYDEETGNIIDDRTIVLEYFSDTGTSGNDTTTTGVMFVNLLLPERYTFVYDAVGYDQRFYEYTLVNETFNNINLTLLNSSSSSTVTITVKDTLDNLLENAVVKILKFDLADNEDDLIEVRRTNFEGQTIAGMILNEPLYRFVIEYDGETVLTTSRTQIYGTDLTLVVNLIQESGFEEIFAGYLMSGSVVFDNATNLFTFTFNDESNTGSNACLRIYRVGSSRTNYNATCTSTTSGSLSLSVQNVSGRTYQAYGYITDSSGYTHTIDTAWAVFTERISDDGSSLIMMILMIIIFATALAVSVEIALVSAFAVPVIFTATGLTSLSYGVTVPLLLIGVILAFVLGVIKK